MPTPSKPDKLTIRAYHVGFGDCFLLSFHYGAAVKRVLIDFGTTGTPDGNDKEVLKKIADQIKADCTNPDGTAKLDAIVVTHRHRDHIRGFSTEKGDGEAGGVIAALKPDLVVQPWTEDPEAPKSSTGPDGEHPHFKAQRMFLASLDSMNAYAAALVDGEINRFQRLSEPGPQVQELAFVGMDNMANKSAVKNLADMGENARFKPEYLCYGMSTALSKLLPGVKVRVLGPPSIKQHAAVQKQAASNPEFWMLRSAFWLAQSGMVGAPAAAEEGKSVHVPMEARWFVEKADEVRASQLLDFVRIMDDTMNNTSVILLFQAGSKSFLFPGDAQIENWEYALKFAGDAQQNCELLKKVSVYKVGHHGSRNATPKTLFQLMTKDRDSGAGTLTSFNSTMPHKHGDEKKHSEVPRKTLVAALRRKSRYLTTESAGKTRPFVEETFPLR